ncbi:hypothetical protein CPB83DRAFT_764880 [Crepidotus variabilis]|uniref:SEC7 domain-containing protein n=1 Tax=Crepidotus variabilis TaxID=179855 RepID=A0A9P6JQN4_9AGAR|nr:hypothetical protein CPB83DRAFT_764880 [Crepidotus variabilis]
MADQESQPSRAPSRAEQRMAAVAKLKRAASLPRMKDGRRPPMHVEAVSEGEKPQSTDEDRTVVSEEEKEKSDGEPIPSDELTATPPQEPEDVIEKERTPEPDSDHPPQPTVEAREEKEDNELDGENPDTEFEERPTSPGTVRKKRRPRSRSRSRGSKDFKGKFKPPSSPMPHLGGDSSQDETPPIPAPIMLPMVPPLASPMPHLPFLQQNRLLRSPTPLPPEMALFYPGTSPPSPLPTLEDIQKNLMRSNSVGHSAAASRRLAMHKLTGGTETYDAPSPSPTPPPFTKLSRNNTVSGGERIAARQNLLNRLGTRVTREADAEAASGAEDRSGPSPTPAKRRRRRSRRGSQSASNAAVSDSDFPSTDHNTPAIPSAPLPNFYDHFAELRAQSTTPNQLSGSRTQSSERPSHGPTPPLPTTKSPEEEKDRPEHHRRRSVLIEDPDPEETEEPSLPQIQPRYPTAPNTPQRTFQSVDAIRTQSSNTPSNSSDSAPASAVGVPLYLSTRTPSRNGSFPTSPFTTPLKERPFSASEEEEEERVIYPATTARPRTPYGNTVDVDREISWIASPVPEIRGPIDDDEDEEVIDEDADDATHDEPRGIDLIEAERDVSGDDAYDDTSPRVSASSKSILVESEISPEQINYGPTSPSSAALSPPSSASKTTDEPVSPQFFPQRLSVASRIHSTGDRSPVGGDYGEWEVYPADSPKRTEASSSSAWEKVITFVRSGSSTGRRSRTNSIVTRERRDNTDSSISRESGASLTGKIDGLLPAQQPQAPPLMQSPSASASILSLPPGPPRASASPIPPASSADRSKYQNAKLFPFPGMIKLEEERRAKAYTPLPTASSPDVSIQSDEIHAPSMQYSFSGSSSQTADGREHRLSHQNSDSRLMTKYASENTPAKHSVPEYIDIPPASPSNGGYNLKLPMTLPGVKQWLKNSKKKNVSPVASAPGTVSFGTLPIIDTPSPPITNKKPSLSDIFGRRPNDLANDWEDQGTTPTNVANRFNANGHTINGARTVEISYETEHTPRAPASVPLEPNTNDDSSCKSPIEPSTSSRITSATPDPSSVSDYPAATPSESSTTSSESSLHVHQGSYVLERLEENLNRGSKGPMWSSTMEDPPRKLILSSPVLQVANQNVVKDRFLFLFSDILVIAKPASSDPHDSISDPFKLSVPDKKYSIKNVVQLQKLRFCADRLEGVGKSTTLGPRNPLIRSFISDFAVEPDRAISSLFTKSGRQPDPSLLGHLLFKTLDLDRSRLGEYLSRRSSKIVLKSYLDNFGFAGLRVDVALRVFLHSLNLTQYAHSEGALEYLLDSFATRWYEANAKFVPYDKDMAVQLVWALVQLNDRLHGSIADETGPTDHIQRTVTTKEFQDAFRRYDIRYLVSDETLQEIYRSIFHEHLCQALPSMMTSQEVSITIKRPIPSRLTYKAQSEPIVFRLPQPDPQFTIELYGQDLIFDPPILQFSRSSEASFRVTGTSLGPKTITMCRSGSNAIKYSGLPLSHSIVVERAFMKNTFQIAFLDQTGLKRRYMFSVDDPIIRNEWATCLRRQIDATNTVAANGPAAFIASRFHKASQTIAFKVLQDTLVGAISRTGSSIGHRINGSASTQNSTSSFSGHLSGSSPFNMSTLHSRSQSRSRVYRKEELELSRSQNSSGDSNDYGLSHSSTPDQRADGTLWTSRDLEMYCQQNSSISVVLSFLQVGTVDQTTPS